ncbi:DNA-(apurinic or apyrimidinic site) lyase /endonuclease III [Clostridium grantii DSM 8605]|uniref:Endonuclease III n=1 Tax=Clostridium grantii DSM 8605 TaxID=1121316 RepID=A0A1M5RRR4_9CLOT|nr:endonuclease III [Clostridium grantii]SHH28975.1 DNA-(apurinic or apyrimidinic site) lyase /endonuclease III [Clostridium grantii DSM 8605]
MRTFNKKTLNNIINILSETYEGAQCGLVFNSSFELLVATMLSAQCTDERVNIITKPLFEKYNTPQSMIQLSQLELGEIIKSCGLYKNKSKNIISTSKSIIEEYNGEVPNTFEELIKLSGVGRKTANVVLANAFNVPTIAVDTHVFRLANRIGLSKGNTPDKVEQDLMKSIPKEKWIQMHHYLIWHGRKICKARKPQCETCPIALYCEYF